MYRSRFCHVLALLGTIVCAAGCGGGKGAPPPSPQRDAGGVVDTGGRGDIGSGECRTCLATMEGKALRFTRIHVTEPRIEEPCPDPPCEPNLALPNFLNTIWGEDVRRNILNILLRLDRSEPAAGTLTFTGGAAWHDRDARALFKVGPYVPLPSELVPSGFHFLPDYTSCFTGTLDSGCTWRSTTAHAKLSFHPGPADAATVCTELYAGQPERQDAIPINEVQATGRIRSDCRGIVDGTISGCIARDAACRICSYMLAPSYASWYDSEIPAIHGPPCSAPYCERWCGRSSTGQLLWVNFGKFVSDLGVQTTCDSDGDGTADGYRIAGTWEAELVELKNDQTPVCPGP